MSKVKPNARKPVVHGIELGSKNVFAASNLPEPDERKLGAQLAACLNDLVAIDCLTQAAAANRMGIAQPHVSEFKHYKLTRFSSEHLLQHITLLIRDIEIFIRPRSSKASQRTSAGAVTVWTAA